MEMQSEISNMLKQLEQEPNNPQFYFQLALAYYKQQQYPQAEQYLNRATELTPNNATYFNVLGVTQISQNKRESALQSFEKSYDLNPNQPDVANNLGTFYLEDKNIKQARNYFEQAIQLKPDFAQAFNNLASIEFSLDNYPLALQHLNKALEIEPDQYMALTNLAKIHKNIGNFYQAKEYAKQSLQINPGHWETYIELADIERIEGEPEKAKQLLEQLLEKDPNNSEALYHLGLIYYAEEEWQQAIDYITQAMRDHKPSLYELGVIASSQITLGRWEDWQATREKAKKMFHESPKCEPVNPFIGQSIFPEIEDYSQVTRRWGEIFKHKLIRPPYPRKHYQHDKIRIGYISPHFTLHSVGLQINDLFARHNRDKFEVYCFPTFSHKHPMYYQICKNCDHVVELVGMNPDKAAATIYQHEIDILIDLAATTDNDNYNILVQQPAAIQCHMLGAMGTLGADFIQYIITSRTVTQDQHLKHFSEIPVRLPTCEIARTGFDIPDTKLYRSDWGLPEDAIVLLAHHNAYRIDPDSFDLWMKILQQAPKAVLWVKVLNDELFTNLQKNAKSANIDPNRIIAHRENVLNKYWQHQLADFFVDAINFSSGTCIFLCAWAGLPMLTLEGNLPQNRIGASFCRATGISEQIVQTKEQYIEQALNWINQPDKLKQIKQNLLATRDKCELFSPDQYICHLEKAYIAMMENYVQGEPKHVLDIE